VKLGRQRREIEKKYLKALFLLHSESRILSSSARRGPFFLCFLSLLLFLSLILSLSTSTLKLFRGKYVKADAGKAGFKWLLFFSTLSDSLSKEGRRERERERG